MADEQELKQARTVFETLCKALEDDDFHFDKDSEKLRVEFGIQGEDLAIPMNINVDAERALTILISHLPVVVPEEKRNDLAVAISMVNYRLVNGVFDYSIQKGRIMFRMDSSFRESLIGVEVFSYMIYSSYKTIDEYNDKFFMLARGMMSMDQFKEFLDNN